MLRRKAYVRLEFFTKSLLVVHRATPAIRGIWTISSQTSPRKPSASLRLPSVVSLPVVTVLERPHEETGNPIQAIRSND